MFVLVFGRRIPRAIAWMISAALGLGAIIWFGIAFFMSFSQGSMSDPPDFALGILVAIPGLIPAFASWALSKRARDVVNDSITGSPSNHPAFVGMDASSPTGTTRRTILGAVVLMIVAILQAAIVSLFVVGQMVSQHVIRPEGGFFLVAALLPAAFASWLAWRVFQTARRFPVSPSFAGSSGCTLLVLGVSSAAFGLLGSTVGTLGYLGTSWYSVGFDPVAVLMFTLGPGLLFEGVANWLLNLGVQEFAGAAER